MVESWPNNVAPVESSMWLHWQTRSFESPVNRVRQVIIGQGVRWRARLVLNVPRRYGKARLTDALMARMQGAGGKIRLWDFDRPTMGIPAAHEPFTDGTFFTDGTGFTDTPKTSGPAARGATTLATKEWPIGSIRPQKGDKFGVGGRLYILTHDCPVNAFGNAILKFAPPLRDAIAADEDVITIRPTSEFRLDEDDQAENVSDVSHMYKYTFNFTEVLSWPGI